MLLDRFQAFPLRFSLFSTASSQTDEEEESLLITSFACQWKHLVNVKKATYKLQRHPFKNMFMGGKGNISSLVDFDPRPRV